MPASARQRMIALVQPGVPRAPSRSRRSPRAQGIFLTIRLTGKFHGLNAATGPTGCFAPRALARGAVPRDLRCAFLLGKSPAATKPTFRRAPRRSACPVQRQQRRDMVGALADQPAARISTARSSGVLARHTGQPRAAAASASSRSAAVATGSSAIVSPLQDVHRPRRPHRSARRH